MAPLKSHLQKALSERAQRQAAHLTATRARFARDRAADDTAAAAAAASKLPAQATSPTQHGGMS